MSDLFNSPDAIVVLNDDETYTNMKGCHVYLLDDSISDSDYDISNFAEEVVDKPGVQVLSIERLVEFYLAFQNMNTHAYNVPVILSGFDQDQYDSDGVPLSEADHVEIDLAIEGNSMPGTNNLPEFNCGVGASPTDIGGMPEINDDDDGVW